MTQKDNREQTDKERILIDAIKEGLYSSEAYSSEFHTLMMAKAVKIGIEDFNHNKYWKLVDRAITEHVREEMAREYFCEWQSCESLIVKMEESFKKSEAL